ncbi:MAG: hypothetical protein ACRCWI_01630 [Brevinema sp.]
MQEWFSRKEIITVVLSIGVGIIIRVIYDFVVKPILKKKAQVVSEKQLKHLIKNASDSPADFTLLLKIISHTENDLFTIYHSKLKRFEKSNLSQQEESDFKDLLKELKKLTK